MTNIEFITDSYTEDGLRLPMVHFSCEEKDICVICIHGMCGTIIDNYFATVWGNMLSKNNIGFIYEHNRGYSIENDIVMKDGSFKRCGCMYEIFEESIYDIDLAITKAKELGYKRIILLGHSYGCNKAVYYYYKKKPDILGIVLASAPDMIEFHKMAEPDFDELLDEAQSCGCPVITSDYWPMNELVPYTEMTADPNNPQDIAEKMVKVLENDDLREQMIKSWLTFSKQFSRENTAKIFVKNILQ